MSSSETSTAADDHASDPGHAPHDESLQVVDDQMHGDGQFQVLDDAQIVCLTCHQRFGADTQHADDVARLEGASDPADQSMLVPMVCPHCDTHGTLVVRYGPEASAEEADLLVHLSRSPNDSGRA